jgi:hypothetical protein
MAFDACAFVGETVFHAVVLAVVDGGLAAGADDAVVREVVADLAKVGLVEDPSRA